MNSPESHPHKLLFICSRNEIRSLTAEKILHGFRGLQVRSAGTQSQARVRVTAGHIGWADLIFVMEKSHLQKLRMKFGPDLEGKKIVTLQIPDEYRFMQQELIDELHTKVAPHVSLAD